MDYKTFGGLAGFGGFPIRVGAPNSKTVQNMDAWDANWASRRDKAISDAREADREAQLSKLGAGAADNGSGKVIYGNVSPGSYDFGPAPSGPPPQPLPPVGPLPYGDIYDVPGAPVAPNPPAYEGIPAPYAPVPFEYGQYGEIYKAFDDERANAFAPTIRNQQAYDSMRGWGQENGVMGANYIDPGHGQINGQAPASPLDQLLGQGSIDPSWATGTYDPYSPNSGTFGGVRSGYDWAF